MASVVLPGETLSSGTWYGDQGQLQSASRPVTYPGPGDDPGHVRTHQAPRDHCEVDLSSAHGCLSPGPSSACRATIILGSSRIYVG